MEVTFFGVRGSIPAPGPEFNRYGGNTSCVAVRSTSGQLVILDAGTGITVLGKQLLAGPFGRGQGEATLMLSHAHWDHIQGFPFFAPVYIPGNRLHIFGPSASAAMVEGILEGQMDPHFSPVCSLRNLGAEIEVHATPDGEPIQIGELTITARKNPHGRCEALAYRVDEGDASVVYAPDAGYREATLPSTIARLYDRASLLIHDCTYTPEDNATRLGRGHSSIADAARVAAASRVGALVMFHYDQDYTDAQVDQLFERCRGLLSNEPHGAKIGLMAAAEGLTLTVPVF